ncbi:family 20 glycosylhydrolase [Roseateles sp. DAIF2]|uniref:beta-N-acetylhexosaminidase n=1 Tax=Roseateles sp. DAIF2 TaxID=2714952 RepID=UPI0018A27C06|nr:family 20 glycosylhydrolase [Roseateles sp. DAIF2]QPF75758.1 family 20 glycosylhydrolase [Roseateles sp. DAIF2]
MPWPRRVQLLQQLAGHRSGRHAPGAALGDFLVTRPQPPGPRLQRAIERLGLSALPLALSLDQPDDGAPPLPGMNEGYRLQIDAARGESTVELRAHSVFGALRGLETLRQLRDLTPSGQPLPALKIDDAPRFPWRGLLLDCARRYLPLDALKRQLDGMAAAKLNVLHWHLTDDQAWRLASTRYPRLQSHANADGCCYTLDEARQLVAYAAERGIRVVPELDVPGHTTALGAAHPELFSAPGPYQPERGFGVFKPCLDPRKPEVYEFLEHIVAEWAAVFPDPCLHIGGDEVEPTHWREALGLDPQVAHAAFNARLAAILAHHGKRLVGWDEVGEGEAAGLAPAELLLQSWRGPDHLQRLARRGHPVLLSAGFYLDQPQASAFHWRRPIVADPAPLPAGRPSQGWQLEIALPVMTLRARLLLWDKEAGACLVFDQQAPLACRVEPSPDGEGELRLALDTWMGETRAVLRRAGAEGGLSGHLRIGNVRYAATGTPLPDEPAAPPPAPAWDAESAARVQGGEAALWAELVGPEQLDLRLWPRLFAVAERFWSPLPDEDGGDEADLYRRLDQISAWSVQALGLHHEAQRLEGLRRLINEASSSQRFELLQRFAALLEPGQYYARQHSKKAAGRYHLDEPLNRLADTLPAENRAMQDLARAPLADPQRWRALLGQIQADQPALLALLEATPGLQALRPLAVHLPALCALGLELLDREALDGYAIDAARHRLDAASTMVDEVVLALAPALEQLLEARLCAA